jgi:dTMP kinase
MGPPPARGSPRRIVALVGADGGGKSTQAARLVSALNSSGYRTESVRPLFLLFNPWRLRPEGRSELSPRRRHLRRAGIRGNGRGGATLRVAIGYLYAVLSYAYLRAYSRDADYVVCDHYFYQFFYDLAGASAGRLAQSFPKPDVVFWLDAPPNLLRARIEKLPNGHEPVAYLESVTEFYRGLASDLQFIRVDATADEGSVADSIWKNLNPGVGQRAV